MQLQDLDYVFITLDIECKGYIEWIELHEFDETIYHDALDIEQLEAAIKTVCGPNSNGKCYRKHFPDIAKELERRHVMEEMIKWDFRALDLENVGRISLENTLFLFKAIHDNCFSNNYWRTFLAKRQNPNADVCLDEIKLYLCNIPEDVVESDEEYVECEQILKIKSNDGRYQIYKELQSLQETEEYLAALEKERIIHANKIINNAKNLLNRMDEVGLHALLEDDLGDGKIYEGRPKEKVTATDLLDALRDKYNVIRDELLLEMLRNNTDDEMWEILSEDEQKEKLFQLKVKEEKLRKEGKLETMAINLPGSRTSVKYNIFSLMGESIPELEQRIADQKEKVRESGLPIEEVVREFGKRLNDKENLNSCYSTLLLDLNNRYQFERDILTKKLLGLGAFHTLTAQDREKIIFSIVQAILRGKQERSFLSCALSIGLSERVKPRNHDRSAKDPDKNHKLSSHRVQVFKDWRSLDGPVLPPRLYAQKSKLGRVDIILQIVQECEHRFSLEREYLLHIMYSKETFQHRISVRNLTKSDCEKQLSIIYLQWLDWRNKPSSEKLLSRLQIKKLFEEGVATKFELVKEETRDDPSMEISDQDAAASLLSALQIKQDTTCQKHLMIDRMDRDELQQVWREQKSANEEERNDNIASIIFSTVEVSKEEIELLDAVQNKYDILKDKLLMQALIEQHGKAEWDKLSEKERQKCVLEMKLKERRLRRDEKYDEIAKLLGDSCLNSELLIKQLGQNRENYLNQLNNRLRNRQRQIEAGEDSDSFKDDLLDEHPSKTTGNIFKDLDQRCEDEKNALMKRLRDEDDRQSQERERQTELTRLRLEARKADREANFDSAALVLGLAERNKAALEDRLKNDRERQEKLAKERLEAHRQRQRKNIRTEEELTDKEEPSKDDIVGWRDLALKELTRTQEQEYNIFSDLIQDPESEDLRQEARELSADERQERLNKLREKRGNLDFSDETDREQHMSIMEMAVAIKYVIWEENAKSTVVEKVDSDKVIISTMANFQEIQDEETRNALDLLPNMSQEELARYRYEQLQAQNNMHLKNTCQLVFKYEGSYANDDEIVKALDEKYDTLLAKLTLEALENQLGEAKWQSLSEKERQEAVFKLKLEQRRLLKEGRLDEAAKLLGEGFAYETNVKRLMGESWKKYEELLRKRLRERKKRIGNRGEEDNLEDESTLVEDLDMKEESIEKQSAKSILENLQQRYEDEKEVLLARLRGADQTFMNEKERQAELIRLKREQRKAQNEERFDTAAMMLGLAERNKAGADAKLSNDRVRQEMIAKERLKILRRKRASRGNDSLPVENESINVEEEEVKSESDVQNDLMKLIEKRQMLEQDELAQYLQIVDDDMYDAASLMTKYSRNTHLSNLKESVKLAGDYTNVIKEMAAFKMVTRIEMLRSANNEKRISHDDAIISIMADLQERQNKEDAEIIRSLKSIQTNELCALQKQELEYISSKQFPQLVNVLGSHDETKVADTYALVSALDSKYEALKDKLILEALEKQLGDSEWANMNERERQEELLKIKLEQKRLKQEGKADEASKILKEFLVNDTNVQSLLGLSKAEQEQRLKDRLAKRKQLKTTGMMDEEIAAQEAKEDEELEEEIAKTSTGNALLDLEKNYETEKDALLNTLNNADSRLVNERHRQLELVRLRREARKIQAEEKFGTAAMVLGVAKSQEAALEVQMKSDRLRQERLAKERLEVRRNKWMSSQKHTGDTLHVEKSNNSITLYGNILNVMENLHESERNMLLELTQDLADPDTSARSLSHEERKKRLFVLNELRKNWKESAENADDQINIFREAMHLKAEEMKQTFDMKDEDVFVKLLADLQDFQDIEAESLMKDLADKDTSTSQQLLRIKQTALAKQCFDNIASVLLSPTKNSPSYLEVDNIEEEISDALREKYDALKKKVYEEALIGKYEKDVWDAMSTNEKEELIADMKANDTLNIQKDKTIGNLEVIMLHSIDNLVDKSVPDVKKATDILKDLESQYEAEKNALFSSLRDANNRGINERERQLTLAVLRRDKMRIKREEKYGSAVLLLNAAKQNEFEKEKIYQNERTRQEQLAKERIASRRRKKKGQWEGQEKLKEGDDASIKKGLTTLEEVGGKRSTVLHESVLMEMEEKHNAERDKLYELIELISPDKLIESSKQNTDEQNTVLNLVSITQNKLKEQCRALIDAEDPDSMSDEERRLFEISLAKVSFDMLQVLYDGLVIALVIKGNNMKKPVKDGRLDDDVTVAIMADLQEIQSVENNALVSALNDFDKEMIESLKRELRKSRIASYFDNLATVIFRGSDEDATQEDDKEEIDEVQKIIDEEAAELLVELEQELEQKKKELPMLSGDEMEEVMKRLKLKEEAGRQAIQEQRTKQQQLAKNKLLEKQKKRHEKLQESQFANDMVLNAHKRGQMMLEKKIAKQDAQKDQLDERLERRREEKKRKREEAEEKERLAREAEKQIEEKQMDITEEIKVLDTTSGENTFVNEPSIPKDAPKVKRKTLLPPLPGGGLKREKTVVEKAADISETKKKEMLNVLIRESTSFELKVSSERIRQQEEVRNRVEKRRHKLQASEIQAAAVLGLGQRQKTMVEERQKGERERQNEKHIERVNRVKQERNSARTSRTSSENDPEISSDKPELTRLSTA